MGSYVAFEEFEDYFNAPVERITEDPYLFLSRADYDTGELYFLLNQTMELDPNQLGELKKFAERGNTVFIAARYFGRAVADSLGIRSVAKYGVREPKLKANFYNPALTLNNTPEFERRIYPVEIEEYDPETTTLLGFADYTKDRVIGPDADEDLLNFVRIPVGDGWFYFHALPEAFSNYYMLKANHEYTERVLSYVTADKIYWDDYIKDGRVYIESRMRYVLNQDTLKWAYYLGLFTLILFVLVRAKREQRMIPLVEPLKNDSKAFTATIGNLHFQYKNYSNIIAKRITYFLERVRSDYLMSTEELDDDFATLLASKSGNSQEESEQLVNLINKLKDKSLHNEADLIALNKALEKFSK